MRKNKKGHRPQWRWPYHSNAPAGRLTPPRRERHGMPFGRAKERFAYFGPCFSRIPPRFHNKKSARPNGCTDWPQQYRPHEVQLVRAMKLRYSAPCIDADCSYLPVMSPSLRGSSPYPWS